MWYTMTAVFLSDAHLKNKYSEGYRNLLDFLLSLRGEISDLFVVGDLFDFWFCRNDTIYPDFEAVINVLLKLKDEGVAIHLFEGNHDFFLAGFFEKYGIRVFPEGTMMEMDEKKIFVSHGDTIDTTNTPYLFLRRFLRSRVFYMTQKALPPAFLWKVAEVSSKMSKDHLARPPDGTIDTMRSFSLKKFRQDCDAAIFGHCHTPLIEHYAIDGRKKTFSILGDWIHYYSYLMYRDGEFVLLTYK